MCAASREAACGRSGSFWPGIDALMGPDRDAFLALPLAERYARFFEHLIEGLRKRPLTYEIMAAEIGEPRNALTAVLEAEREAWGDEASRVLGGAEFARRPELLGLTLLLVAGVRCLLLRSRRIPSFCGVDLRSDAGWGTLQASLRSLALDLFPDEKAR